MLLKRIIPCLDVDRGRVVKGTNFVDIRDAGDPVELASRYDKEGADEVVFLDITASHEKRDTIVELARHCAEELFIPFTIGGGIRSEDDVRALLGAGADKVSLNSAAIQDPDLISACARRFGSQCVVLAIDAKRVASPPGGARAGEPGGCSLGGLPQRRPRPHRPRRRRVGRPGRGTGGGGDTAHLHGPRRHQGRLRPGAHPGGGGGGQRARLSRAGAPGRLDHLVEVIEKGGADAVLAASIFHYGEYTIREAKEYMAARGIPVRL